MSNNGKFLSSLYRDETITSILEEAINRKFELTFIDRDNGVEHILSKGDLSAIRDNGLSKKAEITIEAASSRIRPGNDWIMPTRETISFSRTQPVGYLDLRANEIDIVKIKKIFGSGDKGFLIDSLKFKITPLTPKQIEERKLEIKTQSLEQRADTIKQRGFDIYKELRKTYPKVKFTKEDVVKFIQAEEKSIYESINEDVPPVASYLKHTRKLSRMTERSTI